MIKYQDLRNTVGEISQHCSTLVSMFDNVSNSTESSLKALTNNTSSAVVLLKLNEQVRIYDSLLDDQLDNLKLLEQNLTIAYETRCISEAQFHELDYNLKSVIKSIKTNKTRTAKVLTTILEVVPTPRRIRPSGDVCIFNA